MDATNLIIKKMKNTTLSVLCMIVFHTMVNAQCGINYQDALDKYCSGIYLIHYELDNQYTSSVLLILEGGNSYSMYLLNPSHPFSEYQLVVDSTDVSSYFSVIDNKEAIKYTLDIDETKEHSFKIITKTDEKACVLLAIYLNTDNTLKSGIYKSFEELKYNSPSVEYKYSFKKVKAGRTIGKSYYTYRITMNKEVRDKIGNIYGFCDGNDFYVNITARPRKLRKSTKYARVDNLKKFCYFEYYETTIVPTGQYGSIYSHSIQKRIIDMNTGEVINLKRSSLKQLIMDDTELLHEFENESSKSTKLKEYLIRYIERNHPN